MTYLTLDLVVRNNLIRHAIIAGQRLRSCTQLKRTDTDFVDDTISTTTQQLEGIITNEAILSDIDNQSTTAESSATPEPNNEKYIIVMDCETNRLIKVWLGSGYGK